MSTRGSVYTRVSGQLDLSTAFGALERNDLLPPRPDDHAAGEVGARFIAALQRELAEGRYEADRAYIVPVTKPKYATRPATLLTLADRVVFHALVDPLRARIERGLVAPVTLYWPRGEVTEKKWQTFENAPLSVAGGYIVRTDVSGFYECIDHDLLAEQLVRLTGKADVIDALTEFLGQVMDEPRGLPQGEAASDALASAYLSSVDSAMLRAIHFYWRHGDDVRMTVEDHDAGRRAVHQFESQLRSARLLLNADKTRVLHRETYERQMRAVDGERVRVQEALLAKREKGLLKAEPEEVERLVEKAGIDEETQWGLFYHGNISLDNIVEQLRPHLQPNEVEVAVATYDEATRRAPDGESADALNAEMFHGILTTSFTRLIAARHPCALDDASALISRFPDETELLATYLRALIKTHPQEVAREATAALSGGYLTGWQQTWMLQVIRELLAVSPGAAVDAALDAAETLAADETTSWLARAEAARVLAQASRLGHDLLHRLWAGAPAAVRADLAAAVAAQAHTDDPPAWAEAFRDSLVAEPLLQVVLARARSHAVNTSGDEGETPSTA